MVDLWAFTWYIVKVLSTVLSPPMNQRHTPTFMSNQGFLHLCTTEILVTGNLVTLCCGGMPCALEDVLQYSWLLPARCQGHTRSPSCDSHKGQTSYCKNPEVEKHCDSTPYLLSKLWKGKESNQILQKNLSTSVHPSICSSIRPFYH